MKRSEIKKLDKAWSEAIRWRDTYCQKCGSEERLSAAHLFSRTNRSVRWDLDNGICLCYRCHIHWSHKEPIEFVRWLAQTKGSKFIDMVRRKKNKIAKNQKYQEILDKLKIVC